MTDIKVNDKRGLQESTAPAPNGHDAQPDQVKAAQESLNALQGPMRQVMGIMMRGFMVSCPGFPDHIILSGLCWQLGNLVGGALAADIATHAMLRKNFREAFEDGLAKAPRQQPPATKQPLPPINLKG